MMLVTSLCATICTLRSRHRPVFGNAERRVWARCAVAGSKQLETRRRSSAVPSSQRTTARSSPVVRVVGVRTAVWFGPCAGEWHSEGGLVDGCAFGGGVESAVALHDGTVHHGGDELVGEHASGDVRSRRAASWSRPRWPVDLSRVGHVDLVEVGGAAGSLEVGNDVPAGIVIDVGDDPASTSWANISAVAAPAPIAAPVTTATLSWRTGKVGADARVGLLLRRFNHLTEAADYLMMNVWPEVTCTTGPRTL